jgi:hypothetical protein
LTTSVDKLQPTRSKTASSALSALRLDRAFDGRELALAWTAITLAGVLLFLPHILHGGFYLDDWSNGALTLFNAGGTDFGHIVDSYADATIFRPVLVIYVPLTYWVFGMDVNLHLAWASFLGILVPALLYAVLRTLRVPWIHALAIAGLVLAYPWFDSTRLWVTADQITLATAFALGGLWVALVGLKRDSWRWHAVAATLYLLSIFTYEIALPAIAGLGVVYLFSFGWQRARRRWGVDIAVVILGGAWVLSNTQRETSGLSQDLDHLGKIFEGGFEIIARSVLPVGPGRTTLPLVLIAAVFAAGLLVWWLRRDRPEPPQAGMGLRRWLLLGGAGLGLCALGWVIFVPADPYYTPSIFGVTNRVNGVAGIGAVLLVYAAFGVLGSLLSRFYSRRAAALGLAVTVVLGGLLGLGYLSTIHRHIGIWNSAWQAERTAIDRIEAAYPTLPPYSVVYTTNYPANQAWGVPILSATWDLDGMVKDEYEDGTLGAVPLLYGQGFSCKPKAVQMRTLDPSGKPTGELVAEAAYGAVRILDLESGRGAYPRSRDACLSAIEGLEPGPLVLSGSY